MTPTTLRFLGGVGTVTGSRFLISTGATDVLIDCGLFQGPRDVRQRNWDPFPVDAATIDGVLLSHAHLDHTGYLPALVRAGFDGRASATPDTVALAGVVLPDSGHLQEEEAAYANRARSSRHHPALPLYDEEEARAALEVLRAVPFGKPVCIGDLTARFVPAGHILGSASVVVDVAGRTAVFSGDLGRDVHPLLSPPPPRPAADVVIVESTYGDRRHVPVDEVSAELAEAVRRTAGRGGTIVIPAFAVDRTEMVLFELARLVETDAIPSLPVYVDSPMALRALSTYRAAFEAGSDDVRPDLRGDVDPFEALDLREARSPEESKALNDITYPSIIISASGMASGGRVLHHLARLLPDARNAVLLVGFQAFGTRGRTLQEGARTVKIFGSYVPVRAEVVDVTGLSAHADADDLFDWVAEGEAPSEIYVVHGEPAASAALCQRLGELAPVVVAPRHLEQVRLS